MILGAMPGKETVNFAARSWNRDDSCLSYLHREVNPSMDADRWAKGRLPAIVPALLLVAAVFGRWPYGFYTVLRLVVCGCSIFLAVKANATRSPSWVWIMGGIALLFNPIVPIHLHPNDWRIVDALAAATFIMFVALYKGSELSRD